jgi:hypothetical protein
MKQIDAMNKETLIPVVKEVVRNLVDKKYEYLVEHDALKLLTPELLKIAAEDYPGTMTMPPDSAFEEMDIFGNTDQWKRIDLFLWFDGEKSDLALMCKIIRENEEIVSGIEGILVP